MEKEDEKKEPKKSVSYWEAYNFKDTNQNSIEVVAISLYVEHFYMSAILEAFLKNDRLSLRDLN
ncbi:MAG: hypothetical protein EOO43_00405 [Flavobacterium sp.]|nr:MAG: hypothetical protein EOO43_00405 [Flavobacterium sp.]